MRKFLILLIFVTLFTFITTSSGTAQTRDELQRKYGTPDAKGRYVVRPDIGLSVKYDQNQNLAQMTIEPLNSNSKNASNPVKVMLSDLAQEVLDEFVPTATRGKKITSGNFEFSCHSVDYIEYEQVTINIPKRCSAQGGGIYSINIRWKTDKNIYRVSAFDFPTTKLRIRL